MKNTRCFMYLTIIVTFLLLHHSACSHRTPASEATNNFTPEHIQKNYKMVWNDEFDGESIDTSKWNFRAEGTVRYFATVSRNTISVDGEGHVLIPVTRDENGNYYVGQLGTQGKFETRFGYFECRAKMNRSIGPHVSFWLQSPDIAKTGDPQINGTEIDVFEYHRKTPDIVHHNLHWDGYGADHKTAGIQVPWPGIGEGFHTFGLEWNKNEYVFYVNGKETWRTTTAVSHRDQYLILSTELTGFGGDPSEGTFPDTVTFDYVRVYKPIKEIQ